MRKLLLALVGLLALGVADASAQSASRKYLSAATNNSTLVLGRASVVKVIHAVNTTATLYYLKLYNKATAPTCGTDVPVFVTALPANAAGGAPVSPDVSDGLLFPLGVGFCIVAGIADNDNTNADTGITLNLGVTAR